MKKLTPLAINPDNFREFGCLLDIKTAKAITINDGYATRYDRLATTDISDGTAQVAIFFAKKRPYPMTIEMLERHPLATQAFYPLDQHLWYVIVGRGAEPSGDDLTAFVVAGDVGVQFHKNIWHYPLLISAPTQRFLVVDYAGDKNNLEIIKKDFAEFHPH